MLRLPLTLLSPGGASGRLSILIYHRVLPRHDALNPDEPDANGFETRMRWLRDWFHVLPLTEAVDRLDRGCIPPRALAITFDDGYADNEQFAAPILQRLGLSATFFISTGYLNGGCMWNDRVIEALRASPAEALDLRALGLAQYSLRSQSERRQAVVAILTSIKHLEPERREQATEAIARAAAAPPPPPLMMSTEQVRNLRRLGMDVGAHTVTHPILSRLPLEAARREMADGKAALEAMIDEPIALFAYPNGVPVQDYGAEHVALARQCGFRAAVATAWGAASMHTDRFQLPRFTPWDRQRWRFGVRLLANLKRPQPRLA
jgi:peptidoglycan/xylan/chitin deacetylase (PgdA/CDA1 family)